MDEARGQDWLADRPITVQRRTSHPSSNRKHAIPSMPNPFQNNTFGYLRAHVQNADAFFRHFQRTGARRGTPEVAQDVGWQPTRLQGPRVPMLQTLAPVADLGGEGGKAHYLHAPSPHFAVMTVKSEASACRGARDVESSRCEEADDDTFAGFLSGREGAFQLAHVAKSGRGWICEAESGLFGVVV